MANIIITGSAGFIGSCVAQYFHDAGYTNLILVDDFSIEKKKVNWQHKHYKELVDRNILFEWLQKAENKVDCIVHLGARTDTTEFDYAIHEELNVKYSQKIWAYCTEKNIPMIYASSAATYGAGELGYDDNHEVVEKLQPLNPYGVSKNEFDKWALKQPTTPAAWTGLKFFNVYGPNEYHKARMASVIFHSYNQIQNGGVVKLFRSHKEGYKDGEQLRDFVYVKDIASVILWMVETMLESKWKKSFNGLYNLGAGAARSFNDLVKATFNALDLAPNIEYIDMPEDIRDKYQYFTEAKLDKLYSIGYEPAMHTLEEGVSDYVKNYLSKELFY